MKLATTEDTLEFLQRQYAVFRSGGDSTRAMTLEFNGLVRSSLDKPDVPLRTLYVDLALHDEMIRQSQRANDTSRERIETILRNKIAIENMIRQRESTDVFETVVPVHDLPIRKSEWSIDRVLTLVPEASRAEFRKNLEPSWHKWQRDKLTSQELIRVISQKCIVSGMRTIETFRALFSILELVIDSEVR